MFGELKLVGALLLAAALLLGYKWQLHQARQEGIEECQDEHAAAALQVSIANRAEDQRRLGAQREVNNETQRLAARSRAARTALDARAGGLRHALAAACGGVAPGDPTAVVISPTAPAPELLRADVLGEIEQRLRDLGAEATLTRIAGAACEREYDALTR